MRIGGGRRFVRRLAMLAQVLDIPGAEVSRRRLADVAQRRREAGNKVDFMALRLE